METEDARKTGLKNGLRQLTVTQLCRVVAYPTEMVLDTYNYHEGKFCPLAIALGLDEVVKEPTHEKITLILQLAGYKVNNTRGIKGTFYTDERLRDLRIAAHEVIEEKKRELDTTFC